MKVYTCIRSFEDLENIKRLHSATSESIPSVQLTIWSTAVTTQHIKKRCVGPWCITHVLLFQVQLQGGWSEPSQILSEKCKGVTLCSKLWVLIRGHDPSIMRTFDMLPWSMQFQTKKQRVQCVQGLKVSRTEGKSRLYRVQALSDTASRVRAVCWGEPDYISQYLSTSHTSSSFFHVPVAQ